MLPESPMSWKEAWDIYFVENAGALFNDLARYGLRMPKYHEVATAEAEHLSHQVWGILYTHAHAAAMHFWLPDEKKMNWLSEKYPNTFDKYYRPRYEMWAQMEKEGKRFFNGGLPQLCQVCQIPMLFTEVSKDDPMQIAYRVSEFNGEKFHTCSDGCKDIFDHEPEKYVNAWLPVHQIFQGNCGGATIPDVLNWYHFKPEDGGDYVGSVDEARWKAMHGKTEESTKDAA